MESKEKQVVNKWVATLGDTKEACIGVVSYKQGWGKLGFSRSMIDEPLCLAGKEYSWGLGTHADSEIVLRSTKPLKTFRSLVGVDWNRHSKDTSSAELCFSVKIDGKELAKSHTLKIASEPQFMEVPLDGATEFTLQIKTLNTAHLAHADWAEAQVVTADGEILKIGLPETGSIANSLPVSFNYNGMDSQTWFRKWGIKHTQTDSEDFTLHSYLCCDLETGMQCTVKLKEYKEYPACLWNVYFKNTGHDVTPILEEVKSLDLAWAADKKQLLYRARGSFNYDGSNQSDGEKFCNNFMLVKDNLIDTPEVTMSGINGRSSVDWMPYFNFSGNVEGLIFGVGWTGQWQSKIKSNGVNVHFLAGMESIHTVLHPGESISQPTILMIYWQGDDSIRGHNLLRRFMQNKTLPKDSNNKTLQAPASNLTWGGMIASSHLARIKNIDEEKIPLDYYWIDAGWYGKAGPNKDEFTPQWGSQAGDWSINYDTYPHEFKEISGAIHAIGKKFLLWFEPERAIYGTPVTIEHPEWFLGEKIKGQNVLLNMGNSDARQWCTELIAGLISEQKIDCYRQDFNIEPLPYWQANDTPDRVGMSEIRYIEGLYTFLDELRQRFPDLLIDNCASGGRRLDFEMMRRSIPLWASDMQCFPDYITERNQQFIQGLSYWLPQFAFGTQNHPGDTYHFRSTLAAGINVHLFSYESYPITADYPYQWLIDRLNEYHRAKVYFSGNFYPLLPQSDSLRSWSACQFDRPDLDSGILEVFRKKDSPIVRIDLELQGLDLTKNYEIEDADSKKITTVSGKDLMEKGWPVEIKEKRDSRLFFYHAVGL